jgi:hypothetical protein
MSGTDPQSPILATVEGARTDAGGAAAAPTYEELLTLVAHLRAALETRPVIDQAKGILIGNLGCDAERAFQLLVAQSQHENRKVRDVATELVARSIRQANGDGASRERLDGLSP